MAPRVNIPSTLQWLLLIRRVDRLHWVALSMCLVGAVLQWLVLPQLEEHERTLNNRLVRLGSERAGPQPVSLDEERFLAFRGRLADDADRTELLKVLFVEAGKAGIPLQQGDYSLVPDAEGEYSKLQISLPVKGTYPQIRAYLHALLEKLPALSLDEISFRRDSIKSTTVEARLRLTLYVKMTDKS